MERTRGIASGKSTVSGFLRGFDGVAIVDADMIAREVVQPGQPALKKIVEAFGGGVLSPGGELDRKVLGDIIFGDPVARMKLNRITHPYIQKRMVWQALIAFLSGKTYVILDSPLLYESGKLLSYLNGSAVVYCSEDRQRERLMERNQLSGEEADQRIAAQMPLKVKSKMADFVIDNSNSVEETKIRTIQLHDKLLSMSRVKGISRTQVILLFLLLVGLPCIAWKFISLASAIL